MEWFLFHASSAHLQSLLAISYKKQYLRKFSNDLAIFFLIICQVRNHL